VLTPHAAPDPSQDALEVAVELHAPSIGWHLQIEVLEADDDDAPVVASVEDNTATATTRIRIPLPHAKRWSPDSPHLYCVRVRLSKDGELQDEIRSYAGIRSIGLQGGYLGINGDPIYLKMVLDQGYWPDGGMTAPTDAALRADVEWCKKFGFNGARKHQKVEDPRWLYWCDKLGLLVWGEIGNARNWRLQAEEWFLNEWERTVRRDVNHPSIVTWVPLNESWGVPGLKQNHAGQYAFVERMVALTRRLDGTRPVVDNDGWEHTDVSDIVAIHDYTTGEVLKQRYAHTMATGELPERTWWHDLLLFVGGAKYRGQPIMFTEVGGFLMIPEVPDGQLDALYGLYNTSRTPEELLGQYRELMEVLDGFPFLSGFCYTQLTDIEQEKNGLLTYDRQPKVAPEEIASIHNALFRTT
ncbi:MAG: glycoside hydrolase family 2, partial [Cytophagaceae bacterium]